MESIISRPFAAVVYFCVLGTLYSSMSHSYNYRHKHIYTLSIFPFSNFFVFFLSQSKTLEANLSRLWGADHYLNQPPGSLDKTWWGHSLQRTNSPPSVARVLRGIFTLPTPSYQQYSWLPYGTSLSSSHSLSFASNSHPTHFFCY